MGVGWLNPKLQQGTFECFFGGLRGVVTSLSHEAVVFGQSGQCKIVVGLFQLRLRTWVPCDVGLLQQGHRITGHSVIQQQIDLIICGFFCSGDHQEVGF